MAAGVKVLERKKRTLAEASYVPEIAKGLGKTMGRFFKNTFGPEEKKEIATVCYPEEKREYPPRFRGIHRLTQRADDTEEKARVRLEQFHSNMKAVESCYAGNIVKFDGTTKKEQVFDNLKKCLDEIK